MNTQRATVASFGVPFIAACCALLAGPARAQDRENLGTTGEMLDGIAAIVENGVVLKSELTSRLDIVMGNLRKQQAEQPADQRRPLPPQAVVEQQVLDQLVLREIQLQRAKKVGVTVSDDMLNQALARVADNLGYTLEELPAVLASENIPYAEYREESREDLMIEQLQQRDVINRISVTPRELEQCLAKNDAAATNQFDYNISHILVSVPANAGPQDIEAARAKIDSIYERLENGEDFARLAVATSSAQTALDGGSLGWRKGSQLPTLFADTVVRMKPGEYSKPLQSGSGFQIVKLNDMRGAERTVVEQVHVRQILLRPNEILDEAAVRQKLIGVKEQLDRGDDFATLAKNVSEDKYTANDGGDMGWIDPKEFVPEFAELLRTLAVNEVSQPLRTRYGWQLVEVLGRRTQDTTDEVKQENCARQVRANKAEEERELWIRRLRDQAFVCNYISGGVQDCGMAAAGTVANAGATGKVASKIAASQKKKKNKSL
ncbi:MAG TPA: peptidylprolyl isomerase [Gammaproteobacteria bacterium]|nr:peptidylprolyl isomerase [Gammaproteobacteria bacterium]